MGRMMITAAAALALVGCNGDKDGSGNDTGASTGGDGGGCTTEVAPGYPAAGQADFYYRSALDAGLTNGDGSEVMVLKDAAGAEVAGTSASDGSTLTFTPSAPLTASTEYSVEITTCAAEPVAYSFSTSALGTPTDGCDLTESTFVVDLQGARFLEPAGVAELLLGQLEDDIMLSATAVSDTEIEMIGALGQGGVQDVCTVSLNDFPAATYSDPYFELGPQDTPLGVAGVELTINGL
ncbi:MAG: Ig-like domain-containing protein, partial [Myxococcota bacterium]|nr:Ig-like domain-containing protein [Myxococcota bacterium]